MPAGFDFFAHTYPTFLWEKVGQSIVFRGLLGWAFRQRNFMKNHARLREIPDGRGGFSTLSCLARRSPV
jgi:hypothetical protein